MCILFRLQFWLWYLCFVGLCFNYYMSVLILFAHQFSQWKIANNKLPRIEAESRNCKWITSQNTKVHSHVSRNVFESLNPFNGYGSQLSHRKIVEAILEPNLWKGHVTVYSWLQGEPSHKIVSVPVNSHTHPHPCHCCCPPTPHCPRLLLDPCRRHRCGLCCERDSTQWFDLLSFVVVFCCFLSLYFCVLFCLHRYFWPCCHIIYRLVVFSCWKGNLLNTEMEINVTEM